MKIAIRQLELLNATRSMATMSATNQNIKKGMPTDPWTTNPKFPLPGDVAIDKNQLAEQDAKPVRSATNKYLSACTMLPDLEDESFRKLDVLKQFSEEQELKEIQEMQTDFESTSLEDDLYNDDGLYLETTDDNFTSDDSAHLSVQLSVQQCPQKLKKGFWSLFSDIQESQKDNLTIITFCQKTDSDMSAWSPLMESERETIEANFVEEATMICDILQESGYWADFIDPTSGHAFLGSHSQHTLPETDDRYNQLGFTIEDLGCCKAISHEKWGTHVFVGSLFTNAPASHKGFSKFRHKTGQEEQS